MRVSSQMEVNLCLPRGRGQMGRRERKNEGRKLSGMVKRGWTGLGRSTKNIDKVGKLFISDKIEIIMEREKKLK